MQFICVDCTGAGAIADTAQDEPSRNAAATLRKVLHGKCRGGTWCDCQHKVRK